jgi:subtilisin family serine protease
VPVSTNPENQAVTSEKRRRPEFVPGEALVRFKKNQAFEGVEHLAVPNNDPSVQVFQKSGRQVLAASTEQVQVDVERFEGSDLVDGLRVARMAPDDTIKAVAALRARNDVLYAEPNYIRHTDATPNDPRFLSNELYGLTKIGAPQAWDITTGNSSVVVGVIDEGIDITHPDLQANIWTNPAPGSITGFGPRVKLSSANYNAGEGSGSATITVLRDPGDLHGFDFIRKSGIIPAEGHATHVAGTIGAVGNNSVGVVGVNWQVSLMSLRFIDQATNSGTDADALRAYNYAKQMRDLWVNTNGVNGANIRVLNASYGGGGFSQAAADALAALGQSGILFVAAAGNETSDTDVQPHYPSNYSLSNVISVAATNSNDDLASFSNFGAHSVTLGAPGVSILSTTPSNTYGFLSGTSMATPHVTGAAALLLAANPNLTAEKLRALLAFNGDVVSALQGKSVSGRRLNLFNSLQALAENDTTPPGMVSNLQITSQSGRVINLSWTASGDDGAVGQAALYDISFVDQSSNAVFPLTTVVPAVSGSSQNVSVRIPYRHTAGLIKLREFDNVGNEGNPATVIVTVPLPDADPYIPGTTSPAVLSTGGTALTFNCDDCFKIRTLPFSFSYFGTAYSSVNLSSNGTIYFEPPTPPVRANGDADDVPSSVGGLSPFKMIAGMWDDLDLRISRRADADVYVVQPDSSHVVFRWQGVQFESGNPINFEIELNANGTITTRYGSGNVNLFPVVGISGGEPEVYVISTLTSEQSPLSLTNAQSAIFTPRSLVPMPPPEQIQGAKTIAAPTNASGPRLGPRQISPVPVSPLANGNVTVSFATSDGAGSQPCNVINGNASSRCDYQTSIGTIEFAPDETSKTISIPIVDDSYAEGSETFTLSLSNPSGAPLGTPITATITIGDNDSTTGANPLDVTNFFVRQHYLDFLNREPDPAGLQFWINNIDSCGANQSCIDIKRIDTSAAFFLSIEFQQTGYLIERIYKAAYGDGTGTSTLGGSHQLSVPIIRLNEFLPDTQKIGQGVVVNVGNWQQQLEDNQQAFTQEFVQRSRFTTAYPLSLTPAQFVDGLNTKAGNPLSTAERNQLVDDLTAGVKTRAQVLRVVAEDPDLNSAEFNRAFVLMQYFGYLRRNPDDPQDSDYTGYDFWLGKLNQFNGNYGNADMVKSFLVSGEYQGRFGP